MVKCSTMILENLIAETVRWLKSTQENTVTRQFTQGNNILAAVTVNFADNFIIAQPNILEFNLTQCRQYFS